MDTVDAGRIDMVILDSRATSSMAGSAPSAAGAGSGDVTAELEPLPGLRSQGVLTDEEFAASKAKVLGL